MQCPKTFAALMLEYFGEEIKKEIISVTGKRGQLGQPKEIRSRRNTEVAAGDIWAGARGFDSRHLAADL